MAKEKITAVRGMNDILPQDDPLWDLLLGSVETVVRRYGYMQIRTPILEQTRLFKRGIGEVTDIVEKEMYSFTDSLNGEELTLRPENTASVVRATIEHNLIYDAPRRLWYFGPMFRHERPQRGRYRQFYQVGCEALGFKGPDVDAEQLLLVHRLFKMIGVADSVRLELNCLGQNEERQKYREALIAYFEQHQDILDEDAKRRLYTNPLRILDTKNPDMQELVENAPKLMDYLGEESLDFLKRLEDLLTANGISYVINPRLVRGLDYYNLTVYEWVTDKLGAQATVCGGGRYDPLIEILGGRPAPACGFAMGVERLLELMKECGVKPDYREAQAYLCWQGADVYGYAVKCAETLRDEGVDVIVHAGPAKFAKQMNRADASGADYAVIVGGDEMSKGTVAVKPLREGLKDYGSQVELTVADAALYINRDK